MKYFGVAALLLLSCVAVSAQNFEIAGRVVAVVDGDTIDVLDHGNVSHRIRMSYIDAPERTQPFGQQSRSNLANLLARANVSARCSKMEKNFQGLRARALCTVYRDGKDMNFEQIQTGFAWHYKFYAKEQVAATRTVYADAEMQARAAKRGLWMDKSPIAPWDWRHSLYRSDFKKHR